MNGSPWRSRRALVALALSLALTGCSWFTDFKEQPKVKPWQAQYAGNDTTPMRGSPEYSVPITGDPVPAFVVSHEPLPATIDSMSALPNPHAPTKESLENGRKYFQINCEVCHGRAGKGDGTAVKYGMPAPSLLTDITRNRTDGYIYGMIRNGRGLMPTYDRIEDMDRWDVVNYVRALQGKIPGVVADTSPAGYPGENGATVPTYTRTAPTLPAPYRVRDMDARRSISDGDRTDTPADSSPARQGDTTHAAPEHPAAHPAAHPGARP